MLLPEASAFGESVTGPERFHLVCAARCRRIEGALRGRLPSALEEPVGVHAAMRYAVLGDGKRLRPLLTLSTAAMYGLSFEQAIAPACGIEFLHTVSLIQDDMPFMDDDAIRRGRPSTHARFGQATALLAADGLHALAYEVLAAEVAPRFLPDVVQTVSRAVGSRGIVHGQMLDLKESGSLLSPEQIDNIHAHKTSTLLECCFLLPAILAERPECERDALRRFARSLGIAYQISDDLVDAEEYTEETGRAVDLMRRYLEEAREEAAAFSAREEFEAYLRMIEARVAGLESNEAAG